MDQGDDWLGSVVSAIEGGPQWPNTAVLEAAGGPRVMLGHERGGEG
jgi:hypothetical protein